MAHSGESHQGTLLPPSPSGMEEPWLEPPVTRRPLISGAAGEVVTNPAGAQRYMSAACLKFLFSSPPICSLPRVVFHRLSNLLGFRASVFETSLKIALSVRSEFSTDPRLVCQRTGQISHTCTICRGEYSVTARIQEKQPVLFIELCKSQRDCVDQVYLSNRCRCDRSGADCHVQSRGASNNWSAQYGTRQETQAIPFCRIR